MTCLDAHFIFFKWNIFGSWSNKTSQKHQLFSSWSNFYSFIYVVFYQLIPHYITWITFIMMLKWYSIKHWSTSKLSINNNLITFKFYYHDIAMLDQKLSAKWERLSKPHQLVSLHTSDVLYIFLNVFCLLKTLRTVKFSLFVKSTMLY